ncbi:MAG: hypothetical protein QM621_11705 [Aeromicrobium sp.]|uniref:hypothetical protein n=1 Tax=Aeromicrobium sp. TaxID=1871063 RepID=UPI0039E4E1AB
MGFLRWIGRAVLNVVAFVGALLFVLGLVAVVGTVLVGVVLTVLGEDFSWSIPAVCAVWFLAGWLLVKLSGRDLRELVADLFSVFDW